MQSIFILATANVAAAINNTSLKIVQNYGPETLMVNNSISSRGDVVLVTGPKEEFQKLLEEADQLWVSTAPMLGEWKLRVC